MSEDEHDEGMATSRASFCPAPRDDAAAGFGAASEKPDFVSAMRLLTTSSSSLSSFLHFKMVDWTYGSMIESALWARALRTSANFCSAAS